MEEEGHPLWRLLDMRPIFDQRVEAGQGYLQYFNNNMQDQGRRRVVHFAIFLTPILASFVYVQIMQQKQIIPLDDQSFGYFGYLWTTTTLAVAAFILSVWHLCLRIVGISLGIGLGLGFAGHVYDALADIQDGGGAAVRDRGGGKAVAQSSSVAVMPNLSKDAMKSNTVVDDVNSYHYLMRSAGYSVNNGTLRAQMVKGTQASIANQANNAKRESLAQQQEQNQDGQLQPSGSSRQHRRISLYNFDKGTTASVRMKTMWPNLANIVNESLAKLIEFVLRDYISSWYSKLDEHVVYNDPAEDSPSRPTPMIQDNLPTALSINIVNNADKVSSSPIGDDSERRPKLSDVEEVGSVRSVGSAKSLSEVEATSPKNQHPSSHPAVLQQQRTMILTTTGTHPSPFIDSLYTIFAYALGMLATRASENVNVLDLLLLHFPHILGKNLRVYRKLKDLALEKKHRRVLVEQEQRRKTRVEGSDITGIRSPSESSLKASESFRASTSRQDDEEVSEIAIVREYLLAGRFHRALTFGLDVPSLLFADPLGKVCPLGLTFHDKNEHPDEDAVLYDRLLSSESRLISECELDYCRVLAAKLTKMLVPRTESDSSIMNTMLVEMLASCVLGPVLGCFNPDSVNGWITTGLGLLESKNDSNENAINGIVLETKHPINDEATSIMSEEKDDDGFEEEVFDKCVFRDDEKGIGKKEDFADGSKMRVEQIITLLSMTIIELGSFVDFFGAREKTQDYIINWDALKCQDSVRHLVLIIEAALLSGVRSHPKQQSHAQTKAALSQPNDDDFDIDDDFIETKNMTKGFYNHSSLSAILMEMTGDIDAFDRQVEAVELGEDDDSDNDDVEYIIPKSNELSTMRTLIAAWLHTGQVYKVLSIIVRNRTILQRFYHKDAFLRRNDYAGDFTRLLRQLDGIDILVDTMSVLESQCLLVDNGFENLMRAIKSRPKVLDQKLDPFPEMAGRLRSPSNANLVGSVKANLLNNRNRIARFAQSATEIDLFKDRSMVVPTKSSANISHAHHQNNRSTPAYLAFSTNEVFASSLRLDRERRYASWLKRTNDQKTLDFVARTCGMKEKDVMIHRELHHLSRFFSSNTCDIRIEPCLSADGLLSLANSTANITLKGGGTRRVVEVPDDDSTFLLRASPRPLNPMAVQRDQRNPACGCRVYLAMYEQPAIHLKTKRFNGGRYLHQCLMRYYPNDRTASVTVAPKVSVLDGRKQDDEYRLILTDEFQKLRHSCLKVAVGGLLSSPMMEPGDFCSTPRMGRVLDFAHRISLFERPMVDLGGKIFIVHDISSHRADASSLELSDASMTAAIIVRGSSGLNVSDVSQGAFIIDDGMPLILLRADREDSTKNKSDARPYRASFIRAALLVKSAKQEAQSQRLLYCIRNESAKLSAQNKSDEWLQPALTLLEYASSRRNDRQSILQRDLHLGINHVDRAQLRRNGILNPRYPTILRGLNVRVDGVDEVKGSDFDLLGSPLFLFRIRCTAIAEYIGDVGVGELAVSGNDTSPDDGSKKCEPLKSRYFREEWTILRSLKDFVIFHKHIKGQVNPIEHSVSAGAKLVGSVSAALGGNATIDRRRGPLVPSLAQATKAGNLGVSMKRVMERRKMLLEEYLKYLISPNNLLSRSPELLKFLGAYTSISSQIGKVNSTDEYDRVDVTSVELVTDMLKAGIVQAKQSSERVVNAKDDIGQIAREKTNAAVSPSKAESSGDDLQTLQLGTSTVIEQSADTKEEGKNQPCHAAREMARIRAGAISLKDVRQAIFRLLKDLFDLDNANFFRSRIISVLRTMSVAVAGAQYFNLLLYQNHAKYMNGEWVSGWILYLVTMFWPNGVFYKRGSPVSQDESLRLKVDSKKMIETTFPDQLRTVLGKHTEKGLDMLHEMLQNRLVLKSMAYMLVDLVLVELFPEMNDFVTGAECLEKDA